MAQGVRAEHRRQDPVFVGLLGFWALSAAFVFLYTIYAGQNVPFQDDVTLVAVASGDESLSLSWLWARHNEHRFPLFKLTVWAIARLTDFDLRPLFLMSAGFLSASSLLALWTARRVRGRSHWMDVVYPLYLTSVAHYWNLLQGMGLVFTFYIFLLSLILCGIQLGWCRCFGGASVLGAALVLLVFNGSIGLAVSPPLIASFLFLSSKCRGPVGEKGARLPAAVLACAALTSAVALGAILLSAPIREEGHPPLRFDAFTSIVAVRTWGMAGGVSALALAKLYPYGSAMLLIALVAMGFIVGVRRLMDPEEDREVVVGLLAAYASLLFIGLAVGVGRSGFGGDAGFALQYVSLSAPLPCVLYALSAARRRRTPERLLGAGLLIVGMLALPNNSRFALHEGENRRRAAIDLFEDAGAGVRLKDLGALHKDPYFPWSASIWTSCLEVLRDRKQGPFDPSDSWWIFPRSESKYSPIRLGARSRVGRRQITMTGAGDVRELKDGLLLIPRSPDDVFMLPRIPWQSTSVVKVRLIWLSSTAAGLRFYPQGTDELGRPLGSALIARLDQGTTVVDFVVRLPSRGNRPCITFESAEGTYRLQAYEWRP